MKNGLQISCDKLISDNDSHSQPILYNEIIEGRELYLKCLKNKNYNKLIKEQLVNPLIHKYNTSEKDIIIKIKIIPKNNINYCYNRFVTSNIFTFGRSPKCDVILDDNNISRIHFFGIVIDNKILIIDTWSLFGTNIYNNKDDVINSVDNRRILKFDMDKRFILDLSDYLIVLNADKAVNDRYCLVCMSAPRIIRNSCGHGVLCQDCNNKLKTYNEEYKCPICKDLMRQAHISNCSNTYYSNTL